jgi:hypothetical protein
LTIAIVEFTSQTVLETLYSWSGIVGATISAKRCRTQATIVEASK